jgi:TATA-binding protein-associated factor
MFFTLLDYSSKLSTKPLGIKSVVLLSLITYFLSNQVASMVIVSWFKETKSRTDQGKTSEAAIVVQPVLVRLLELLGCGDPSSPTPGSTAPYGELARMFTKMRTEASALIKHAESIGTFKRSLLASLPSTDTIGAESAVDLASRLLQPSQPHGGDGDEKSITASDAMESARQRLLATAGYLQVVQVWRPFLYSGIDALLVNGSSKLPGWTSWN